jgi:hypothetical protein
MADRDRRTEDEQNPGEGFLRRWSRRKTETRRSPETPAVASREPLERAPAPREQTAEPEKVAPAPIDPADLPDIESLTADSDFSVFMRPGVPEHLRTLALRKLWRSDPIFSKLDGLVEYGEDYTIPSWPKGTIKTAYQIGRGFVKELEKLVAAGDEKLVAAGDRPPPPQGPATGPEPDARPAPTADSPAEASPPAPASPPRSARPPAKKRRLAAKT